VCLRDWWAGRAAFAKVRRASRSANGTETGARRRAPRQARDALGMPKGARPSAVVVFVA